MLPEGTMATEEKLMVDDRFKYLRRMKGRYARASREERSQLLDEMEAFTGMHRKSLIRSMNSDVKRKPRRRQRGSTYGPEVRDALRVISRGLDGICAERLTPNLVWLAEHMAVHGELDVSQDLLEKLGHISVSTVKRILRSVCQDRPRLPRRRPKQRSSWLSEVPMKRIPWDLKEPGHFEVDLVHHCGPTAAGEYVCTIQMIDVTTGWSERVAVLGRSYLVMRDGFHRILDRLPFPVQEIHPDNGSEFFNNHMRRFWNDKLQDLQLSRSRPYRKNDNRFVEQKNSTLVRAYLGYDRFDTVAQTRAANILYDRMWLYYNFFQPVMRMSEKIIDRTSEDNTFRVKRRYDNARTPFDRLCATKAISDHLQDQLEMLRVQTSIIQLHEEIYRLMDSLFALPNATPGTTEDVFLTLTADLFNHPKEVST